MTKQYCKNYTQKKRKCVVGKNLSPKCISDGNYFYFINIYFINLLF